MQHLNGPKINLVFKPYFWIQHVNFFLWHFIFKTGNLTDLRSVHRLGKAFPLEPLDTEEHSGMMVLAARQLENEGLLK